MAIFFTLILAFMFCPYVFAEDNYALEKIIVTGNSACKPGQNYPSETLSLKNSLGNHSNSISDIFKNSSGIDLRSRSAFGIQGDMSIRGSTYEQVAVLIDGIKINDMQTGHHNMDIPLTIMDIEKIEIVKQGSSSFYGASALSGSINIITKKPVEKSAIIEALAGGHGLYSQAFGCDMPGKNISTSFSAEHKTSNGARPNTDFDYKTYSYMLNKKWADNSLNFTAGYQDKDFGADSFYSNLYKEEEEHTNTLFLKTGIDTSMTSYDFKNSVFLRRHTDKFILNRNNPSFSQNTHTTYSYGIHSGINMPIKYGDMETGFEIARDTIDSTKLGKNTRMNQAYFLGFNPEPGNKLEPSARFRIDHFQNWSYQSSYDAGFGYWLIDNKLKIKSSFSHSFRGPSFTELYYSDAANKGSPDLKVEKSDNYSFSLETNPNNIPLVCGIFLRKVENLIDYTRLTVNDIWQATNLGNVDFKGAELKAGPFSYTYMEADRNTSDFLSKYALDILKHQLMLNLSRDIKTIKICLQMAYNERKFGETYFIGNISFSKAFQNKRTYIEPFVKIDNFTDTDYSEVSGVAQPGRWLQCGIKIKW